LKKLIIAGIAIITSVALCASVWPPSAEVGDLPNEPVKTAVNAEVEAWSEEMPQILIPADSNTPEPEAVAEKEHQAPVISTSSSEPHMGDVRVVNCEKQIYILGFG